MFDLRNEKILDTMLLKGLEALGRKDLINDLQEQKLVAVFDVSDEDKLVIGLVRNQNTDTAPLTVQANVSKLLDHADFVFEIDVKLGQVNLIKDETNRGHTIAISPEDCPELSQALKDAPIVIVVHPSDIKGFYEIDADDKQHIIILLLGEEALVWLQGHNIETLRQNKHILMPKLMSYVKHMIVYSIKDKKCTKVK